MQGRVDWAGVGNLIRKGVRRLEAAMAEGLVICANIMHRASIRPGRQTLSRGGWIIAKKYRIPHIIKQA